jgi:hypothetical protein
MEMEMIDKNIKIYSYDEWDFTGYGGFDDRVYIDLDGNLITGILEGFYGYTSDTKDEKNCQYVENGKRKEGYYER